jgi:hypothetical protein
MSSMVRLVAGNQGPVTTSSVPRTLKSYDIAGRCRVTTWRQAEMRSDHLPTMRSDLPIVRNPFLIEMKDLPVCSRSLPLVGTERETA